MGGLEEYLNRQQVGAVESEGVFTLDPVKAREKLRQFQLPQPDYCLLKFVQAAVAWGATIIFVEQLKGLVRFDFLPSQELPPAPRWATFLDKPLEAEDRGARHLTVGLMAALGRFHSLGWSYVLNGERHSLLITPEEVRCQVEPTDDFEACLTLVGGKPPALDLIVQHCRFTPIQVVVNGENTWKKPSYKEPLLLEAYLPGEGLAVPGPQWDQVKASSRVDQVWIGQIRGVWPVKKKPRAWLYQSVGTQEKMGPRYRCGAQVEIQDMAPQGRKSELVLVVDGVAIQPLPIELPCLARVVLHEPAIKQDLSGFQVVKDGSFRRVMGNLKAQLSALINTLKRHGDLLPPAKLNIKEQDPEAFGDWFLLERVQYRGYEEKYRAVPRTLNTWEETLLTVCRHPERAAAFLRETRELEGFVHPRVFSLLDWGEVDGIPYRVESPHYGVSLEKLVPVTGLEMPLVCGYLDELVRVVQDLHNEGLVCGPRLSSDSVVLSSGRIYLVNTLGFRLDPRMNVLGHLRPESVRWTSPEEIQGHPGPAADQYRLGLLTYFMLTGSHPFEADEPMRIVMGHLQGPAPDPRESRPDTPKAMAVAIQRALSKDPEERFADVTEFGSAVGMAFI